MKRGTMLAGLLVVATAAAVGAAVVPHEPAAPGQQDPASREARQDGERTRVPRAVELLGAREVHIGVSVRDLEGEQAAGAAGARVDDVRAEGPAAKAGVRAGDVIVEFDGERVRSARHLSRLVSETPAGRTVRATVLREGKRHELQVTPEAGAMAWGEGPMRFTIPGLHMDERSFRFERPGGESGDRGFELFVESGRGRLGIGTQELTPQLADYFGTSGGVLVTRVDDGSPAAKAGLRAGDVITSVNDRPVGSPMELRRELARAADGDDVSIGYTRDRKSATTKAELEKRERPRRPARPA
jgi:serine protease Do